MPAVASLSEFNRNQTALIDTLEKTQEPIYLTRNGKASVVVMDAAAFDRMVSAKERAQKREMDVYQGLMRGYADVLEWAVEMLSAFPSLGPVYDPEYIAARPPFPCRYLPLPDTPFTLYYTVDEAALRVTIIDIEWSAGDPRKRFPGL